MLASLKSASLKSVASIALIATVSTPALAAGDSTSGKQYFVSQAILTNDAGTPICAVSTAGEPDLGPQGVEVAPEGFQSKIKTGLRACNAQETAVVWQQSSVRYKKPEQGLLPVAAAAWTVCQITGLVGFGSGAIFEKYSGEFNESQLIPGLAGGMHEGISRLPQKLIVTRAATGGIVGLVCGAIGQGTYRVAKKGVHYIMENGLPEAKAPKHRTR